MPNCELTCMCLHTYYRTLIRVPEDELLDELLYDGMEDGAATGMLCTVQHAPPRPGTVAALRPTPQPGARGEVVDQTAQPLLPL